MDLNIDKRQIGFLYVGQRIELPERPIRGVGYTFMISNGMVTGVLICFSNGIESELHEIRYDNKIYKIQVETQKLVFKDKIIKNNEVIHIDSNTAPDDISRIFNVTCDCWQDASEAGMNFIDVDCEFEFSWSLLGKDVMQLNYMSITKSQNMTS